MDAQRAPARHSVDGERFPVEPGTVTVIGRGQVHVFERAVGLSGAVVRFESEVLLGRARRGSSAAGAR